LPRLRVVRQETSVDDGFKRGGRLNFKVQRAARKPCEWQHHFWFRIEPSDVRKLEDALEGRGSFEIAHLMFSVMVNDKLRTVADLRVNVIAEKEDKEEYFELLNGTNFAGKDPILNEGLSSGSSGRVFKLEDGYMLNPSNEQVIFERNEQQMLAEFAAPPKHQIKNRRWVYRAENQWDGMSVNELPPRQINGQIIQRFMIQNLNSSALIGVACRKMGKILFTIVDGENARYSAFDRKLDVIVTNQRELGQEFVATEDDDLLELTENVAKEAWLSKFARDYKERRTARSKVVIDELECFNHDLGHGLYVKSLESMDLKTVFDARDLDVIYLPEHQDLLIILPSNPDARWMLENQEQFLKTLLALNDGNRQRFTFCHNDKKGECNNLTFRVGKITRRVYVRRKRETVYDVDRYPD
jgi:hypothetical protein